MKKRMVYCILPVAALLLELLPCGAVCNFANPDGAPWRKTFSYFSLVPFGYANVGPFLTAVLTVGILALLAAFLLTGKRPLLLWVKLLLSAGIVLSLCPLLLGVHFFSVVGALITASLLAELCLLLAAGRATNTGPPAARRATPPL